MIPTLARLSTTSVAKYSSTQLLPHYQQPVKRVALNIVGWAACFSVFMAWPLAVIEYETRVNGPDPAKL